MNILYHHRTQAQGAAGTHIRQVVDAFEKLGHSVDIVSPPFVNSFSGEKKSSFRVKRHKIPQLFFELYEIFYNCIAIIKIIRRLNKKKYGFIYERYAIFNIAGLLTAKLKKIPIIIESSFTSKTIVFPKRTRLLAKFAYSIDKVFFKYVDAIVVVSTVLKNSLINEFYVDPSKVFVIPNAVDEERFKPDISSEAIKRQYGLNGFKIIGFAGGFYPWHGLDMLIDGVPLLLKSFDHVKFLLVGDGAIMKSLKQKVKRLNLTETIIFTGMVPHAELPQYISAFDIGIMPDSNDYGSPMKILEYMAMKKPVVAPRLGPIEEIVADGKDGLLFERKNREDLILLLKKLLEDDELCRTMGSTAYKKIITQHTWKKNMKDILELYENINRGRLKL